MSAAAVVRGAVRRLLDGVDVRCGVLAVGCSGGADSLALAEAAVHYGRRHDLAVHGLVVDHGLQPGSAGVAARAADTLGALGCVKVIVSTVSIGGPANLEAAARAARYQALDAARPHPSALVLLGHTLDDQAETVLLGLGRGSGPRSIAGMRELDPPWARPLLTVRRADTAAACAELGLTPWLDPHNTDPRFRRARLRAEVLPLLEDVLAGGVAEALARTATQLREDNDTLDALATALLHSATPSPPTPSPVITPPSPMITGKWSLVDLQERPFARDQHGGEHRDEQQGQGLGLDVGVLGGAPVAVRRRALRAWLLAGGVSGLTDEHLRRVDALIGQWRGQGAVALPGGRSVRRHAGRLRLDR